MIEMTPEERSNIDAENYYRLVLIVRSIAVARPQNLVKFCDDHASIQDIVLDDPLGKKIFLFTSIPNHKETSNIVRSRKQ